MSDGSLSNDLGIFNSSWRQIYKAASRGLVSTVYGDYIGDSKQLGTYNFKNLLPNGDWDGFNTLKEIGAILVHVERHRAYFQITFDYSQLNEGIIALRDNRQSFCHSIPVLQAA